MTNIERIKGTLTPCEKFGVSRYAADMIDDAVNARGFVAIVQRDYAWERGVIVTDSHLVKGDELTVTEFVNRLNEALNADGVKELELDGMLYVSVDTEPYQYQIRVKEGKVSNQSA